MIKATFIGGPIHGELRALEGRMPDFVVLVRDQIPFDANDDDEVPPAREAVYINLGPNPEHDLFMYVGTRNA